VLRDHSVFTPVRDFGIPPTFLDQGKRADVLARIGLTAQDVAREIVGTVATLGAVTVELATPPESNASTTP
jgi:1-deoxy-D-xylulose-5-phosphate synthase